MLHGKQLSSGRCANQSQVQGISLTLYVYQLRKDGKGQESVGVEKVTYTKKVES